MLLALPREPERLLRYELIDRRPMAETTTVRWDANRSDVMDMEMSMRIAVRKRTGLVSGCMYSSKPILLLLLLLSYCTVLFMMIS